MVQLFFTSSPPKSEPVPNARGPGKIVTGEMKTGMSFIIVCPLDFFAKDSINENQKYKSAALIFYLFLVKREKLKKTLEK